jgi:carboxypeptidase Q
MNDSMMRRLRPPRPGHRFFIAIALTLPAAVRPQQSTAATPPPPAGQRSVAVPRDDDVIRRIVREGTERSHVEPDLEYLLDVIGPRLAGSPEMRRANEWTQEKFLEYGMDRSDLEGWTFGVGWTRGPMTLRMLAPQHRELFGASWAWAPGTHGPLAGDVVYMDARTQSDFDRRFAGKLRGAWVMVGPAYAVLNPDGPRTAADSARADSIRRAVAARTPDEQRFTPARFQVLVREGIAGIIRDGAKEFGLLTMSGSPSAISPYPQIVVSNETYSQFQRLALRGEPVRIEADVSNSFTKEPLQQYNTVAELRGSDKPGEVVLVGAHLDSWDLATGGTDNGTGAIAVLEAARILRAAGVKPRRTIRFVLFGGEEEGLFGSQAYTAAHEADLDKLQAVLVLDNGTGRITGIALQGRDELRDMWKAMLQPLASLGPLAVRSGIKTGTDHLAFVQFGVPSFNYDQLSRGYDHTHHSQIDDLAHTVPEDVAQAATIMAVNAWQLADLSTLLPRK